MNGDCLSFRRDLRIYLKTIDDDPEMVETFTFGYLAEMDMPPIGFLPSGANVRAYLLWHLDDIFHATFSCRGNGCSHGLLKGIIFFKEPCMYKMRPIPGEGFDTTVYLPFPASIAFQTLMESGSKNPVFMEP